MTGSNVTSMQRLGYREPADVAEPEQLVLVEYVSDGKPWWACPPAGAGRSSFPVCSAQAKPCRC
jgi:hypothetical protein